VPDEKAVPTLLTGSLEGWLAGWPADGAGMGTVRQGGEMFSLGLLGAFCEAAVQYCMPEGGLECGPCGCGCGLGSGLLGAGDLKVLMTGI
jgi:hypothetical protein